MMNSHFQVEANGNCAYIPLMKKKPARLMETMRPQISDMGLTVRRSQLAGNMKKIQRRVFEYLIQPDILGLQDTKKLHWVIKCGLDGSSNSDVNQEGTNSTATNHEFHLIFKRSTDDSDDDVVR